jgi:hypothetical protein
VDFKYKTNKSNVLHCKDLGASNFWKGVMWIANVIKMGYRWKVRDGSKIRFWKDVRIASSSLAIQYWKIYYLINEHNKTIVDLWDGDNLRCTFRSCVDSRLFGLWGEVV